MQTFLPYSDFMESARVLDRQRLGKQRVEVLQILRAIESGSGWSNHPAVKMWNGYQNCLVEYGLCMCHEWIRRGYKDTCSEKIAGLRDVHPFKVPDWIGDEEFHRSHQSNLIRKDPEHYRHFFPDVPDDLPYVWPSSKGVTS